MRKFKLGLGAVRSFVLLFSLTGVLILTLIAHLSEVPDVELKHLREYSGETVECGGTVIGSVKYDSGSVKLLIHENGTVVELYIEDLDDSFEPGERLSVKGEVYTYSSRVGVTVQNGRYISREGKVPVLDLLHGSNTGRIYNTMGHISRVHRMDRGDLEGEIIFDGGLNRSATYIDIDASELAIKPRTGDLVNVTGLLTDKKQLVCFGPGSVVVLQRAVPVEYSIGRVVDELASGYSELITRSLIIECYSKYEPMGSSLYLSDEPSGSDISIKGRIDRDQGLFIHKGDLVRIENASLSWEPQEARYVLEIGTLMLIEPHGPWSINLDSLSWGVGEFEEVEVTTTGSLEEKGGDLYIVDEEVMLRVVGAGEMELGVEREYSGVVRFDTGRNDYYLDTGGIP